jgi:hypothetical protein
MTTKRASIGLALVLVAAPSRAAEPEPVRLVVDAPRDCATEEAIVADLDVLGASFRAPRDEDERARVFTMTITPEERVHGRLVVKDLVGVETTRETDAATCLEAARSVALFAAIALDEGPPPPGPAPVSAAPVYWPTSNGEGSTRFVAPKRRGSGGIAITAHTGGVIKEGPSYGVHSYAGFLAWGSTRVGAAAAAATDVREGAKREHGARVDVRGTSLRAGALLGWGAPWNDSVAGFVAELGVAGGWANGTIQNPSAVQRPATNIGCFGDECQSFDPEAAHRERFVSPYVGWSLVLQIPWRLPVRPIAELGGVWIPGSPGGDLISTFEAGLAWQAW